MTSTKTLIRVAIADDHICFREGLKHVLTQYAGDSIQLVAEAKDGEELLRAVKNYRPDVVLTDVRMPQLDGIQACREISKIFPSVNLIGMSCFDNAALVYEMLEAGAKGYVSKTALPCEMIEAIHTVRKGQTFYCNHTSRTLVRLIAPCRYNAFGDNRGRTLSGNEVAIIKLICQQLTTKEIAEELHLCIKSVENYSKQIKEKTKAKNIVGIAMFAIKNGYVGAHEL